MDDASARASLLLSVRPPIDADRSGDLTTKARALLDRKDALEGQVVTLRDVWPATFAASDAPPPTIRVWRRRLDGSATSCSGRVDVVPFEDYVKGVLPHEWISSWDPKALEMGAVTIRTYAWWWVQAGGKYDCADLDDTTASQVYEDERLAKTDAAVDATAGAAIFKDGSLVFAEYSAENGSPTDFGVDDPLCAGEAVFGHGRGTCQWGTQRWATEEGRDFVWMAAHYYPGAEARVPGEPWRAAFAAESYPTHMTAGEEVEVWIELANQGSALWSTSDTRIGTTGPTDRASPFFEEGNWLAPNRPSAADHSDYGPGAVGRFTFVLKAPEVDEPTQFVETFGLVQEGVTWFGGEETLVTWAINVDPKPNDSGTFLDGGCTVTVPRGSGRGALSSRTAVLLALAGWAWRRGRRFRIIAAYVAFAMGLAGVSACAPETGVASTQRELLGGDSSLVPLFKEAAKESGVPAEILATVGFVETRLRMGLDRDPAMTGHGMPARYGLMALRDVEQASFLLGLEPEFVKSDPRSNIRAAAALLSVRAAELGLDTRELRGFAPALDGIGDEVMRRLQRGWRGLDEDGRWVVVSAQAVAGLEDGVSAQTFALGYPGAQWAPANTGNYQSASRGAAQINYIVIHTVQGSYAGCISWFQNASANVSAHYVVRSSDGEVTQMVDDSDIAWHDACFNSETIGIEHEGYVDDPDAWYTEALYAGSARLTSWLADQYGVPKDRDHIFGHGEAPDCSDHTDPGSGWNWAHYMELVGSGGATTFDAHSAEAVGAYPTVMTSGDEAVAYFEFVNDGNTTWGLDETRLGTQDPQDRESAFYMAGNWLSPSRPTGADHSNYGPGSTGRFSFMIKAPEVDTETTYTETFQLVQEGVQWFGPTVQMTITVEPRGAGGTGGEEGGGDEGQDPSNPGAGGEHGDGMSGGCRVGAGTAGSGAPFALVCLCAILGLGVGSRRRRR